MSLQKQKVYPLDKPIKLSVYLTNNIENDYQIEKILIFPANIDMIIESPIENALSYNDFSLGFIKKSEFVIPFFVRFSNQFSNSVGKFIIEWSDKNLKSFTKLIRNQCEIIFPEINAKKCDVELQYKIPKNVCTKQEISFEIIIQNNTDEFKRILFLVDTSNNFVCSGSVKKKLLLYPNEVKAMQLPIIPIYYGKLKLPPFKIMEFPLMGNNYENKIYSIYQIPECITISENL